MSPLAHTLSRSRGRGLSVHAASRERRGGWGASLDYTCLRPRGRVLSALVNLPAIALLFVYYTALLLLTIYSLHRFYLIRLLRRAPAIVDAAPPNRWPSLTVQLPLYNE